MENRRSELFLLGEDRRIVGSGGSSRGNSLVKFRVVRHHRPHELREGFRDLVVRDLSRPKCLLKQLRIETRRGDFAAHLRHGTAHLDRILDWLEYLFFERCRSLIPEVFAGTIIRIVRQSHRMPRSLLSVKSLAELVGIRKVVFLFVTRRAARAIVV